VGARIEADRLPVPGAARAVARAADGDPLEWALSGREDYELLFTLSADRVAEVAGAVRSAAGTLVSVIREVRPREEGILLFRDSVETPLGTGGWDHFRGRSS
jgi:thiamine-monophosphate kinase